MQSGEVTCLGSEQDQSLTSVPLLWDLHSHLSDTFHQLCPAPHPFHQLDLDLGGGQRPHWRSGGDTGVREG